MTYVSDGIASDNLGQIIGRGAVLRTKCPVAGACDRFGHNATKSSAGQCGNGGSSLNAICTRTPEE